MVINMNNEQYNIDGFIFPNQKEYAAAKDEWNTVEYIKKNSDLNSEAIAYKLFNKLSEKNTFKTVIGLKFHKELRDNLLKTGNYKEEDLKHIHVHSTKENSSISSAVNTIKEDKDSNALRNARIINIFLVITILAMFAVTIYT